MCDQRCAKCSYSAYCGTLGVHCEYILLTGKMRPCPAGEKCTVFTTKPIRREEEDWTQDLFMKEKGISGEGVVPLPG